MLTDFSSEEDAKETYYSSDSGNDATGDGDDAAAGEWGELQEEPTDWTAGWRLWYQEDQSQAGRYRWFVLRPHPEEDKLQSINPSGKTESHPTDVRLDAVPHSTDEQAMRDAYQTWVEENAAGDDTEQSEAEAWGQWERMQQVGDWWVWTRQHDTEQRQQFLVAGEQQDGTAVYLHPDGSISTDAHVYDSPDAVQSALDAYYQRVEEGDVSEDEQPTGNTPTRGEIKSAAKNAGANGDGKGAMTDIGGLVTPRNLLIGGAAAAGLYVANESGALDEIMDGAGGGA